MITLVIAPHPDDEVLGVGGTIRKRVLDGHEVHVCICTKGVHNMFDRDVIMEGQLEAQKVATYLGINSIRFLNLPAAELDRVPLIEVIDSIAKVIQDVHPDEVFIPHRGDIHNDHKVIADAALVALRPKSTPVPFRLYSYEVPSETGWDNPVCGNEFIPNVYEEIEDTIEDKIFAVKLYQSQAETWPGARSAKAVKALAEYRGSSVCVPCAEAFHLIRQVI